MKTTEELQRLLNKLALIHPAEIGLRAGEAGELIREVLEFRQSDNKPNRMTPEEVEEFNRNNYGPESKYNLPADKFPPYA